MKWLTIVEGRGIAVFEDTGGGWQTNFCHQKKLRIRESGERQYNIFGAVAVLFIEQTRKQVGAQCSHTGMQARGGAMSKSQW